MLYEEKELAEVEVAILRLQKRINRVAIANWFMIPLYVLVTFWIWSWAIQFYPSFLGGILAMITIVLGLPLIAALVFSIFFGVLILSILGTFFDDKRNLSALYLRQENLKKMLEKQRELHRQYEEEKSRQLFLKSFVLAGSWYRKEADTRLAKKIIMSEVIESSRIRLEREPENEHDPYALKVYLDELWIGYVPKRYSEELVQALQAWEALKEEEREPIRYDLSWGLDPYLEEKKGFILEVIIKRK